MRSKAIRIPAILPRDLAIDVAETGKESVISFGNVCRENNEGPRTICRNYSTVLKDQHSPGTFTEAG
jgi:hypothetical protein